MANLVLPLTVTSYDERMFASVLPVRKQKERFEILRRGAACAQLDREQITELIAITANLFEERNRVRTVFDRLPQQFGEVRHF